jgi:hypothetical protein
MLQQVNHAELLIDNKDEWITSEKGVLVLVCFLKGANDKVIPKMGGSRN